MRPSVGERICGLLTLGLATATGCANQSCSTAARRSGSDPPEESFGVSVVLLNVSTREREVELDLGGFAPSASQIYRTVYRPGESETWVSLGSLPAGNLLLLPSRSAATVVVDG